MWPKDIEFVWILVPILDPFPKEADMQNLHTVQWFGYFFML